MARPRRQQTGRVPTGMAPTMCHGIERHSEKEGKSCGDCQRRSEPRGRHESLLGVRRRLAKKNAGPLSRSITEWVASGQRPHRDTEECRSDRGEAIQQASGSQDEGYASYGGHTRHAVDSARSQFQVIAWCSGGIEEAELRLRTVVTAAGCPHFPHPGHRFHNN